MPKRLIFLIDDDPIFQAVVEHILQREGYELVKAVSGLDAVQVAETMAPLPDLIICDIMFPFIDGLRLITLFRARAGWEHQFDMRFGRLIASGQLASGGFAGGSLTAEIHPDPIDPYALLVGWGRTNLQNYFNLNFDPNDSWLLGASWKPDERTAVTLFQIRDDRLDTHQRVTHLVARMPGTAGYTWSVDLFHRAGWASAIPDGRPVHRWGLSASLEHGALFTRLAWDPRANFGPTSMLRWSVGMRF